MKYLVIGNIKRKGKFLPRGKEAEFEAAEGDALVRRGYLAPARTAAKAADKPGADKTGE